VQTGTRTVIIDLSGITALDSTGIGYNDRRLQPHHGRRRRDAHGRRHRPHPAKFRVNQLDRVFAFYPSVEEAAKE